MKKITLIILSLISTLCFLSACNANSNENCNHTFGDWATLKSTTCIEDGELVRVCSKCLAEEKTTIAKTNVHVEVVDDAVLATCEGTGLTEGKHCSRCNQVIVEQTIVGALGHKFVTYVSDGNATIEADGTKTAHCENNGCDKTDTITDVGSKLPTTHSHSYSSIVTYPTCTKQGFTTYTCGCGNSYIDSYTSALNHNEVSHEGKGASCTEIGWEDYVTCTRCDYSTYKEIPAGHNYVNNICTACGNAYASQGLAFATFRSGYAVTGIGDCSDTTIVIPSEYNGLPVIAITEGAFKSNQKIIEVIVPDSVLLIEDEAFSYSKKLTKVELGNGVVEIGMSFAGCDGLTTITIPASVTTIDTLAFYLAKNMESIEVDGGNSIYSSLDGILYNKDKTTLEYCPPKIAKADIIIPSSVTTISSYSFVDCVTVKTITMSNGVQTLENSAFSKCKNLESIVMSNNITKIQNYAFEGCSSLKSCVVPNGVTWIYPYVFRNCTSLEWIYISKNIEMIYYDPFEGCSALQTVYFGGTEAEWNAIRYSDSMPSYAGINIVFEYDMPCSHETVIDEAREPTCTTTGLSEGSHCVGCSKIFIQQNIIDKLGHDFNDEKCIRCDTKYPKGLKLKLAENGTEYIVSGYDGNNSEIIIPEKYNGLKITSIKSDAFNGCRSLTNVTIGNSIIEIGSYAFAYCSSLKNIVIGENVKIIGNAAFLSCTSLESIIIPNSVLNIGESAFSYSSKLKHVTFGDNVETIGNCAFRYCESLVSAILPNSVITIGNEAFSGCKALVKVELGYNLKSIGMLGFYNCEAIHTVNYLGDINKWAEIEFFGNRANPIYYAKKLYINNNLVTEIDLTIATKISNYAFQNCTSIINVEMGDCVISIGDGAFEGCNSLVNVYLSNNLIEVGSNPFGLCNKLVYNIENGLMYLGSYTNKYLYLDGTVNLDITQASINNNCKFIGAWAFSGCKLLTNISIPNSVLSIGDTFMCCPTFYMSLCVLSVLTLLVRLVYSYFLILSNI